MVRIHHGRRRGVSYWGKLLGGVAGFAMGGPPGAVLGAALGHAADSGALERLPPALRQGTRRLQNGLRNSASLHPARFAAMFAPREQVFALSIVALAAKLAKCDGPVSRPEIDAFKRHFRIPPESAHNVGRLFDQARDSPDDFEPYARQLGDSFADSRGLLEDVLASLFSIARADGAINQRELDFLSRTARGFGLNGAAWDRARDGASRGAAGAEPDAYAVLGVAAGASNEAVRAAWKKLVRENHPDGLAARGVPAEFIARATEKVASINAAWDRVKRERGL